MKNFLRPLLQKYFSSFLYFYKYLRNKIFLSVLLSTLVGVLDGFGLTMFFPLLQMVNDNSDGNGVDMGNLQFLVNFIESTGFKINLIVILAFMLLFFSLKGVAIYFSNAYRVFLMQSFIRMIRIRMLNGLNKLSFKAFISTDVGRIQNTMTGEVERVSLAYREYFAALQQIILVLVYIGFAFFIDAQFAILVTIGGWFTNYVYKKVFQKTKGASRQLTNASHVYQGQVIQHVANYKYLKATGLVQNFSNMLHQNIIGIEKARRKIGILNGVLAGSREPLLILVVALVIVLETTIFSASLGPILISLLFFYRALAALMMLQNNWNNYLSVAGSMENMTAFQDYLNNNIEHKGSTPFHEFKHEIRAEMISFSFDETKILKDISLTIKKYETVAFVGESGGGKTTLINLIAGLLLPDKGSLTIDGIKIEEIDTTAYQQRIGYITQEPVVFNDTIFNNVTFWAENNSENIKKFNEAIHKASLTKLLIELPEGFETVLGNNGINLSGGQKQRISIARELYKDIDILIMDEATSALDSETEKLIQLNIEQLKGNYTILIVAHRLSTIKNADRIVFMRDGQILKIGKFEELAEEYIDFKEMVKMQLL